MGYDSIVWRTASFEQLILFIIIKLLTASIPSVNIIIYQNTYSQVLKGGLPIGYNERYC
jgi:hypothetical protein